MTLSRYDIDALARGDVEAFKRVYDALAPRLLYYVHRLVRQHDASEDIVHETMVFLWENREKISDVIDLKAWLFTIAHNHTRNYIRTKGLRRKILDKLEIMPEPDQQLIITAEICGEIRNVVMELPTQTRQIIELSMHGLSVAQTAEILGVSPNTIKTLKKSGYRTLREKLGHLRAIFLLL